MSEPEVNGAEQESDAVESPPKGTGKVVWIVVLVSGLLGATVGGIAVGPRLGAGSVDALAKEEENKRDHDKAATEAAAEDKPSSVGAEGVLELNNITVNPAGTDGFRFLMATIAIDLGDKDLVEEMRAKNYEVRDRITAILESQDMDMLTAPGARDSLRVLIATAIEPLLEGRHVVDVFIPYLIIQ